MMMAILTVIKFFNVSRFDVALIVTCMPVASGNYKNENSSIESIYITCSLVIPKKLGTSSTEWKVFTVRATASQARKH